MVKYKGDAYSVTAQIIDEAWDKGDITDKQLEDILDCARDCPVEFAGELNHVLRPTLECEKERLLRLKYGGR